MKYWFDTEFIENGSTIDLISIGIVSEDGREYYVENSECDLTKACPWVKEHVIPHLHGGDLLKSRATIAKEIVEFVGTHPEFWVYYGSYDWVVLCQLYGRMIDLPDVWPYFPMDLVQLQQCHFDNFNYQVESEQKHNALEDARWLKIAHKELEFAIKHKHT